MFQSSLIGTHQQAIDWDGSSCLMRQAVIGLLLALLWWPDVAHAAINSSGLLDTALQNFQTSAAGWATYITARASWLFWTLAVISLTWTMGQLVLRRADIGEFLGEFLSFTVMTGFFGWLLTNGPTFAMQIINSMRQLAGSASGLGPNVYPSTLVDIGFQLLDRVVTQSSVWAPVQSMVCFLASFVILLVVALIAINMLVLLVSGWILAYAGIFFLGFGGSRWTSDMAINYYRTVLSLGAQLAGMVLVVGIGFSFINLYYVNMSAQISIKEMAVLMVAAIILLGLVNKIPPLLGGLAMGGGVGALGSGASVASMVGTAAMMATGVGLAANMARAGMAGLTGGPQALMAAVSKGAAGSAAGTNMIASMPGGGPSDGGPSNTPPSGSPAGGGAAGGFPLTQAMGGVHPGPQFAGRTYPSVANSQSDTSRPSSEPTFGSESLSKGTATHDKTFNPQEEIAAFRDRKGPFTVLQGGKA
ncbi:MAG: P-type conjugative transfer protein TrbL [Nitrospira sp.]|jgi:P-type conjugative transfer protein TrbL|nr:P-type conjugative transfer protein TrbL [Nitrospira sp.]